MQDSGIWMTFANLTVLRRSGTNVSKPHLKLFNRDGKWCILDEGSSNGTFVRDDEIIVGKPTPIRNNSFIKLSRGNGGAVIYFSY